jgi:hypothetical protein
VHSCVGRVLILAWREGNKKSENKDAKLEEKWNRIGRNTSRMTWVFVIITN